MFIMNTYPLMIKYILLYYIEVTWASKQKMNGNIGNDELILLDKNRNNHIKDKSPETIWFQGFYLVGVTGLEPTTSCSLSKHSSHLSYTPMITLC